MTIRFRRVHDSEAPHLTAIAFAAKRHWQYPEAWIELWSDELTVTREYILTNPVFGAVSGGSLAGWYALDCREKDWELDYFWVLPEKMGCGVGTAMMQHAKGLFYSSQAETLSVISDPHAEPFYLKMGFQKVGTHPSTPKGRILPMLAFRRQWL